jgi:hypothetical protein
MPKGCWDQGKWDISRWDIDTHDAWSALLKALKNIPTPYPKILVDGTVDCIVDSVGNEARVDVYTDHWEQMKRTLKKV